LDKGEKSVQQTFEKNQSLKPKYAFGAVFVYCSMAYKSEAFQQSPYFITKAACA